MDPTPAAAPASRPPDLPEPLRSRIAALRFAGERDGAQLWDVDLVGGGGGRHVLKILPLAPGAGELDEVFRLRAEHEALRALGHPEIVAYAELVLDADRLLLLRPRAEGEALARRTGEVAPAEALRIVARVAAVLAKAHAAGHLHRSLRPGNVVVAPRAPPGAAPAGKGGASLSEAPPLVVRLLDWGIARLLPRRAGGAHGLSVDAFAYLAPEQTGLLQRPVDARADIWALGLLLYELVAGRRPFDGASPEMLLRATVTREHPPLAAQRPDVPPLLDAIVSRLLAKEPAERYQRAQAVAFDLEELARRIDGGELDASFALGTDDSRGGLRVVAPLVGRDSVLTRLTRALERAASGNGALALLGGPAGVGKSRLASEITERAARMGGRALWGRCSATTRGVPYAPIVEALEALTDRAPGSALAAEDSDALALRIHRAIGDLVGDVVRVVPDLAELLPRTAPLRELPPQHALFRSREALARLLGAIGVEGRPLVLVLEDLEHADGATLKLLAHLDQGELRTAPLLVIGTHTERGDAGRPRVRDLAAGLRFELAPLDRVTAIALATAALGASEAGEGGHLAERIVDGTGGSPVRILEAAHAWLDARDLSRAAAAGPVARPPRGGVRSPASFQVSAALATAGTALDLEALAAVTALAPRELLPALDEARERDLAVRVPGARSRYRVRDESARLAFLATLHEDERVSWQRRVARALPLEGAPLAWRAVAFGHALAIADRERIRELGPEVASRALEVLAADEALAAARATLEAGAPLAPTDALRAELVVARAQALLGRSHEAVTAYHSALREVSERGERLKISRELAALALADGQPEQAVEALLRTRRGLKLWVPRSELTARIDVALQRAVDAIQRVNDSRGLTSVAPPRRELSLEVVDWLECYARALEPLRPRRSTGARLRALHLAARLGTVEAFPRLLERESREWLRRGNVEWAVRLARRALSERESTASLSAAAPAHRALGEVLLAAGRIEEALSHLEEAVRGFDEQGDAWGAAPALEHLGRAFGARGEWYRSAEVWERLLRLLRRLGDDRAVARVVALLALAYARVGDDRHALELIAMEPQADLPVEVRGERDLHVAQAKLALGRAAEVGEHLERAALWLAADPAAAPWFPAELALAQAEALLAHRAQAAAHSDLATAAPASGPPDAAKLDAAVAHAVKRARRWPCLRARAYRVEAQARRASAPREGRSLRRWWRAVETSLEEARRVGARWEEATTLLEAAAGLEARGDSRGRAYRVRAERLLAQGVSPVVSLVSPASAPHAAAQGGAPGPAREVLRFATPVPVRLPEVLSEKRRWKSLLELNQAISSILELNELLERVVDLGLEVTGAQRGFLILLESEPDAVAHLGRVPDGAAPSHRFAGPFQNLKVARHAGTGDGRVRHFGGSRSIVESVLRDGAAVLRADARRDPEFGKKGSVAGQQIRSVLAVPLVRGGLVHGVLYVDNPLVAGLIHERERELLEVFATQAAITIDNARAYAEIAALERRMAGENVRLKEHLRAEARPGDIVGHSRALEVALERVRRVAPTESTVLLTGETGVGKELFARAIHDASPRRDGAFVKIDCAALPATLLESELFGYERGAFTGADRRRIGKFELAHGGTVFLDEIGNIPLDLQVKLLQVLQAKTIVRLGGRGPIDVDVRVVGATNRDLEEAVREGSFREDLFYRLNVVPIRVPPLRERREDVRELVGHFVARFNRALGREVHVIPESVMHELEEYPWPGNIRELEHLIERSLVLADGPELVLTGFSPVTGPRAGATRATDDLPLAEGLRQFKILRVQRALEVAGGNRAEAARLLGLHRQNLGRLMRQLGLETESDAAGDTAADLAPLPE